MSRLFRVLVVPLFAGLALMSCQLSCAANPVKTAAGATVENRPETVAFALYNSYIVVAEHAANVAEDSATSRSVRKAIVALHESASPALKRLRQTALDYKRIREAYNSDSTLAGKLTKALDALTIAIDSAAPKVNALANEVSKGGGI